MSDKKISILGWIMFFVFKTYAFLLPTYLLGAEILQPICDYVLQKFCNPLKC